MADAPKRDEPDAADTRLNRLLNMILESAVEAVGFDAATVTTRRHGGLATIAATDQRLVALDDVQYDSGDGPCVTVLDPHEPLHVEDAASDTRWEHFRQTAEHLGVHSTLSIHVPVDAEDLAVSLNFYAKERLSMGAEQVHHAVTYAEQLGATILSVDAYRSAARLAQGMVEAMASRAAIEQAKGIIMADERITADDAFQRLVTLSQHANMKLRDVAQRLVTERTRPMD